VGPKAKTLEKEESWGTLPNAKHFKGKKACWNIGSTWGIGYYISKGWRKTSKTTNYSNDHICKGTLRIASAKGGGKPPRQLIPAMTTLVGGPWISPSWTTWYPPWYPMAPSLPLMVLIQ
jgi:hypothetical protein